MTFPILKNLCLFTDFGPILAWILLGTFRDFLSADKVGVCNFGFRGRVYVLLLKTRESLPTNSIVMSISTDYGPFYKSNIYCIEYTNLFKQWWIWIAESRLHTKGLWAKGIVFGLWRVCCFWNWRRKSLQCSNFFQEQNFKAELP